MQRRSPRLSGWAAVIGCTAVIGCVLGAAAGCSESDGGAVALGAAGSGGGVGGEMGGSPASAGGTGAMPPGAGLGEGVGGAQGAVVGAAGADQAPPGPSSLGDAGLEVAADAGQGRLDAGAVSTLDPELALRLTGLSSRLSVLAARTSSFWFEHGPDVVFGGFHGTLDRQGNPVAPDDKGLIQQARHLWMLSTWCERRGAAAELVLLAEQTYSFFKSSFVDADGGFVFKVSRDGTRVVDAKKQMFAESYAIYALSTYGRVFHDAEATALALDRFASIDASRHDALNGGYDQRADPGFLTAGAEKDTNTHLHLMEAFSALFEATHDPRVGTRLNELVDLFATRLRQPSGYVHAEFKLDWALFGAPRVSYGHDLETAWLLLDAARVLGRGADEVPRSAALAIAESSAGPGFDALAGGFFEAGAVGGLADDFDKIWWVQFEAMEGLWWSYELSGDSLYLDRLGRTLDWVESTEDLPVGEWFATTNPDGSAAGSDYKSDEWKASYHTVRALVFLQDWIDDELAGRSAP